MENTPETVTEAVIPATECPHYIPTRDAEAGATRCRGCRVRGTLRNKGGRDGLYRTRNPRYPTLFLHPKVAA